MNILVTGGAGYVGSVVTEELINAGCDVVVLDNLQQGRRKAVLEGAKFAVGDICNTEDLDGVFKDNKLDAVMHMAAETVVEYSVTDPKRYFRNNIVGGLNLLDAMLRYGIYKFIFSSSAAVYGEPVDVPIKEGHPKVPLNSYGESKLVFERVLAWYGRAYGLKHISFRYFNAAGASERLGEDHRPETHLIPNVLKAALDTNRPVHIFGNDYPTRDGTCVRDYVHVIDIAQAHILALLKLDELGCGVYNLGSGDGYTVLEVVEEARKVSGVDIPVIYSPRRAGDPTVLLANSTRARSELGWRPRFPELGAIVKSAWRWIDQHPEGYEVPSLQSMGQEKQPL